MNIYQVTHSYDLTELDKFLPTKKEAIKYAKQLTETYGKDGLHFEKHSINATKVDICEALTRYPSR